MGPTFQTRSLRGSTSLPSRRKQVTDPTRKWYLECQLSVKAPPNPRVRSRSSHASRRLRGYRLPPVVWLRGSVRPCVRMFRNFPLYTHFIALLRCLCFSTSTLLTPDFGQSLLCPRLAFPLRTWLKYTTRTVHLLKARTAWTSWSSPLTMWFPGIDHRSLILILYFERGSHFLELAV